MSFLNNIKDFFGMGEEEYEVDEQGYTKDAPYAESEEEAKRNKVVNIHATAQLQVILVKPEVFADTKQIADHLNSKKTVVLNLESASKEVARRLVDFLSGVAYANQGNVQKIANSTFLITPYNVDISGIGLLDDIDTQGALY